MQNGDRAKRKRHFTKTKLEFFVENTVCVGYLYLPGAASRSLPLVVMGHGFSGTQQGSLAQTASDFAAQGFAVWTFDYRGFGESGGEPRQVIDLPSQLADWHAAIEFARSFSEIDTRKIFLWGSSLSGGLVVSAAAADPQVAGLVAQVPFNGFPAKAPGRTIASSLRLVFAAFYDALRGRLGLSPFYVPVIGPPGTRAIINSEKAEDIIAAMSSTWWQNRVAPRAILQMSRFRPTDDAPRVKCPALLCVATEDEHTPPKLALELARALPRAEVLEFPASHFEFYDEAYRTRLVSAQLDFFRRQFASV